ncbi:MAG TPA: hypothetical protein PL015_01820 [Opitutaceae bacterium]|nr:hypothetical protein [Opitutaceae bacterium]
MKETNNDLQPPEWQRERSLLLELLEHQATDIEIRAQADRTPVFLDLGRLLIRPDAVQSIEPSGHGSKINGALNATLAPKAILALLGAEIIAPEDGNPTAGVTK